MKLLESVHANDQKINIQPQTIEQKLDEAILDFKKEEHILKKMFGRTNG